MSRSLKTLSNQALPTQVTLLLKDRLPYFVQGPCELFCNLKVERQSNYYKLSLKVEGNVNITCQRCLTPFDYPYSNISELAICHNDQIAEQLMSSMECVVSPGDEFDLLSIVTDELHLYCPEKHEALSDCDAVVHPYLKDEEE